MSQIPLHVCLACSMYLVMNRCPFYVSSLHLMRKFSNSFIKSHRMPVVLLHVILMPEFSIRGLIVQIGSTDDGGNRLLQQH